MTAGPPTEPPILILTAEQVRVCVESVLAAGRDGRSIPTCGRQLADSHEALRADREALRARLRDAEARIAEVEPLAQAADAYCWSPTPENTTQLMNARARYQTLVGRRRLAERHADPQEKP